MNISGNYAENSGYVQAASVNELLTKNAKAENGQEKAASSSGDKVTVSEIARETAAQQTKKATQAANFPKEIPAEENLSYSQIKQLTTSDGTEVRFEAAYQNDKNATRQTISVRVNFTDKNGENYSHTLNDSSILTQDENGRWQVKQIEGNTASGTANDDIIILLPTGKPLMGVTDSGHVLGKFTENKTAITVDAGEGNNVVMDFSGDTTRITTGSGNDTIIGSSNTGRYVVDSGAGDDSIELTGSESYVYAGDGDDTLTMNTNSVRKVSGGAGNDSITFKNNVSIESNYIREDKVYFDERIEIFERFTASRYADDEGVIDGGDGDDIINFNQRAGGKIFGGNGKDTISYNESGHNVYINGGAGDDLIEPKGTGGSAVIDGGEGNDTINSMEGGGTIRGGAGDDHIYLGMSGGPLNVSGGEGNDYIEQAATGGTTYINGGTGNDTISTTISGGSHYVTGGEGDDLIYANLWGGGYSTLKGGGGNDFLIAERSPELRMTQKKLEQLAAARKEQQLQDKKNADKEISEYDKQLAEAAIGFNENADANMTYEQFQQMVKRNTAERIAQSRQALLNLQRAAAAYSQQGRAVPR